MNLEIKDLDLKSMEIAKNRIDSLVKPIGSLGRLEELSIKLAGIYKNSMIKELKKKVIVFASDNGIVEEGVASAPPIVTYIQSINIASYKSGVGAICKALGAELTLYDVGVNGEFNDSRIKVRKIKNGTNNFAKGPAMTKEEALKSIQIGIQISNEENQDNMVFATGEMGIGNTSSSTAVLCCIGNIDPSLITGFGANLPVNLLDNKISVIRQGISINNVDKNDPIDILHKVGGFDIGVMAGFMLGCAKNSKLVIIDGYISTVAALLAVMINPKVKEYMIPSHSTYEKGGKLASELLGLRPYLDMEMRLGEGSGSALMFGIIDSAISMNLNMLTFDESGIEKV